MVTRLTAELDRVYGPLPASFELATESRPRPLAPQPGVNVPPSPGEHPSSLVQIRRAPEFAGGGFWPSKRQRWPAANPVEECVSALVRFGTAFAICRVSRTNGRRTMEAIELGSSNAVHEKGEWEYSSTRKNTSALGVDAAP